MSSNNMDERIVKLQLNNKDFERNARVSMNTLNELNSSLDLTGTAKNVSKSLSEVNDNTALISSTMDNVSKSWSAWEVVAITTISRITNQVIDLGERLVKSLSVDQISSGWSKFGELTKNTATLAAQGLKDATGEDADIEGNLKKLLWFSDATSYSFTDMTNNISKFTAAGQTLDDSTTAMMGIANWAAMAGQNASTASRAMYQISQAMSTGTMRYQDWKSIQNANMDTVQFREQAVQAAIEAGQLYKEADDLYRTLEGKEYSLSQLFSSDGLGDLWFTADVMMDTFSRFSSAVEAAYSTGKDPYEAIAEYEKTVEDMTDEDQKQLAEFGLAAFKAAQECRTLEDAINAIKDAVSSGFMKSFELVFGSLEEAKKLWNDVYDSLERIFIGKSMTIRNKALEMWKEVGGRDDLFANTEDNIGALFNLLNSVGEIVDLFRESFLEVFFDIDSTLSDEETTKALADKFKMLTETINKMSKAIYDGVIKHKTTIKNIIKIAYNSIKLIVNVLRLGIKTIKSVVSGIKPLFKLISSGPAGLLGITEKLNAKLERLIETTGIFSKIEKTLTKITTALTNAIVKMHVVDNIKKSFNDFKKALLNNGKTVESLKKIWDSLKTVLSKTSKMIINIIPNITSLLGKTLTKAIYYLAKGLVKLVDVSDKLFNNLKKWKNKPKTVERWNKLLDFLSKRIDQLESRIKSIYRTIKEFISGLKFNKITSAFDSIGDSIEKLGKSITKFGKKHSGKKKAKATSIISDVIPDVEKPSDETTDNIKKQVSQWKVFLDKLEPLLNSVIAVAASSLGLITTALNLLSKIIDKFSKFITDHNWLNKKTLTKVAIVAAFAFFIKILYDLVMSMKIVEALADTLYAYSTYLRAKSLYIFAAAIRSFAISFALVAASVAYFGHIDSKQMKAGTKRLAEIVGIFAGFITVLAVLSKLFGPKGEISKSFYGVFGNKADKVLERSFKTSAFAQLGVNIASMTSSLISLSIALWIMTKPLVKLAKLKKDVFKTGFERLAMILVLMGGTLGVISASAGILGRLKNPTETVKMLTKAAKSLVATSVSLMLIQYVMSKFSQMKVSTYKKGIQRLGIIFAAVTAYMVLMVSLHRDSKMEKLTNDVLKTKTTLVSSNTALDAITRNIVALTATISALMLASYKLSKLKGTEFAKSLGVIAVILGAISALSFLMATLNKGKEIKALTKVMKSNTAGSKTGILSTIGNVGILLTGLSLMLTSISVSMLIFRDLDDRDILRGSAIIASFLGGISIILFALSAFSKNGIPSDISELTTGLSDTATGLSKSVKNLTVLLVSMTALIAVFTLVSYLSNKQIINGIKVFATVVAAMYAMIGSLALLNKLSKVSFGKTILTTTIMIGSLYALIGALALLSKINFKWKKTIQIILQFAAIIASIAIIFKALSQVSKSLDISTLGYLSAMFASLYLMVGLIALLNNVPIDSKTWKQAGKALVAFAAAIGAFVLVCAGLTVLAVVFPVIAVGLTMLGLMTIVILAFAAALWILEKIDIEKITDKIIAFAKMLSNFVTEFLSIAEENISIWVDKLVNIFISIIEGLTVRIGDILTAMNTFFMTLMKEIILMAKEFFTKHGKEIKNIILDAILLPFRSVKETFKIIKQFFSDLYHNLKSALNGDMSWKEFGKNLVLGLWNGIKDKTQWIIDQIKSFGNKIKNTIKNIFGIHSPSRFMMGIGEYLDLGLAKGIDQEADVITKPINTIANMIADGIDDQLTITPVMDLSEIQNGTKNMNDMLNATNGYSINPSMASNAYRSVDNRNTSIKASEIQPVSQSGDNYVLNNTFNITGNADPDDIADAVSKKIAEQISRRKTTWQ